MLKNTKYALDTNVILRYLLKDELGKVPDIQRREEVL